ncbi:tetratricopeptide repeat protein [Thermodesulfobacteriota bacterium]
MLSSISQWFVDPINQEILLWVIIAFALGIFLGIWIRRSRFGKDSSMVRSGDPSFFKGIQYIISNDRDNAIEEFTKSVQVNSDTVETYIALGNLFRSKGDIERAIRIRQNIILRPNISEQIKLKTLFDLGLDYRKGGFLNRAINVFQQVLQKSPSDLKTLKEIESIYEELQDWENAYRIRQQIEKLDKGNHKNILAHYLVEMGKVELNRGREDEAISLLNKAISVHDKCLDAYLHLGDIYFGKNDYQKAIHTWKKVVNVAPQFTYLAYRRLEGAYSRMKNLEPVEKFLKECSGMGSDAFTSMALARYLYNDGDTKGALKELNAVIGSNPGFWEARRLKGEFLILEGRDKDALAEYADILEHLDMPSLRFQCSQCGFEPNELMWQCPKCRKWDTIKLLGFSKPRSG